MGPRRGKRVSDWEATWTIVSKVSKITWLASEARQPSNRASVSRKPLGFLSIDSELLGRNPAIWSFRHRNSLDPGLVPIFAQFPEAQQEPPETAFSPALPDEHDVTKHVLETLVNALVVEIAREKKSTSQCLFFLTNYTNNL